MKPQSPRLFIFTPDHCKTLLSIGASKPVCHSGWDVKSLELAVILWNRVVKQLPYNPPTEYLFPDEKRKLRLVKRIRKQIDKFDLTKEELGLVTD